MTDPVLEARDIAVEFTTPHGIVRAVDGVSLSIAVGETVGIVGESGSGKSVFSRALMGLLEASPNARVSGSVSFGDLELREISEKQRALLWGSEIATVFQDPATALSPTKTIGRHLTEMLRRHLGLGRREARERALELLVQVGIPAPLRRMKQYPHEMSGGMRQRVCIALAIACSPRLLIADEPTTALDVTVQRQVLDLFHRITEENRMSTILISHDLEVVSNQAQRVLVMYAGRAVELAEAQELVARPQHPYSGALLAAAPRLAADPHARLLAIPGRVPDLRRQIDGCAFAPRCARASDRCLVEQPPLAHSADSADHRVACFHPLTEPAAESSAKAAAS